MTDDAILLPTLAEDHWLAKLCDGWRLKWIVQTETWGAQLCVILWKPA